MNIPCTDPHPYDDDIDDAGDLPAEVVANVSHPRPDHGVKRAVTRAHLEAAIAAGAEQLRSLRALLAALEAE